MKIILAAGLYPPDIGGPATAALQLADFLRAQGIEVAVVPFGDVRHVPPIVRHMIYCWRVYREATGARYVVALDPVSVGLPALVAARLRGVPFILRVGGDYAWEQGVQRFGIQETLDQFSVKDMSAYPFPVRLMAGIQSYVARHAIAVVAPSDYLKTIVLSWKVDPEKITRIYSGAEVGALPTKQEARITFGFGSEPVVVSAGRFVPWKGFPALIDAVALLKADRQNIRLLIAGSGPDDAALRTHAASLGDSIRFMGDMPKKELLGLVRAADLFVLNTNYEGLSHQLIEVMQAGTPIVTTHVGGNLELIEDGVSGKLVAFNDIHAIAEAITSTLSQPELARQMAVHALEKAKTFGSAHAMSAWGALLGINDTSLRVLMISGDRLALSQGSDVYKRLLLQAAEVGQLDVFVQGDKKELAIKGRGMVHGFSGSKIQAAFSMLRASSSVGRVDIVTAQDPFLLGLVAWRIARKKNAKLQLQVHTNICSPAFIRQFKLKSLLTRFLLSQADTVRVVSEEIHQGIVRMGITAPISVLPVCIDEAAIRAAAPADLKKEFPQFSKYIVVAARLEEEKRVDEIIAAMKDVVSLVPGVGLLVAGDGSQMQTLQAQAKSLGIAHSIVFLGRRSDVYSLYKSADLVVAATAAYEGFGATAVEALAAGAPVIATRDAGVAKEAGAIVALGSQLAEAAVRVLQEGQRGVLQLQLPTADRWAKGWRESLEAGRVKP